MSTRKFAFKIDWPLGIRHSKYIYDVKRVKEFDFNFIKATLLLIGKHKVRVGDEN